MSTSDPWLIRHIELSEEIPSVPAELNPHGCYVVFWWKGLPLGDQVIPTEQLPMTASQLMECALRSMAPAVESYLHESGAAGSHVQMAPERPLEQLREQVACTEADEPLSSVSVVVCTRDRPEQLKQCLSSLQKLSRRPEEILVVDNAPHTETTRQIVADMQDVRYVLEPRAGLGVARNTGITHSTGDIVAFTDDDVIVHPDWIRRLQGGFRRPEVMAVTGLVLPVELETEAQHTFETYWSFNRGYAPKTFDSAFFEPTRRYGAPVWEIGAGANMAFRRRAFELLGGFDERLGAGASGCSEDSEMWYRVLAEGGCCRYEPSAVVYHRHRRSSAALEHQLHEYMRGHVAALLIQFEKYRHTGNLFRTFVFLPFRYASLFGQRMLNRNRPEAHMLKAQVAGYMKGLAFYLKHRRASDVSRLPDKEAIRRSLSESDVS